MTDLSASKAEEAAYEDCIVSFTDVLGFRALLTTRSAKDVLEVLENMKHFAETAENDQDIDPKAPRFTSRAFAFAMSDAIVRVRPYGTVYRDGALIWELQDLIHAQIALVNLGVFVRGGLTVGQAHVGALGSGPVFGPAVARAYEIETEEAVFPRIVVADAVIAAHRTDPRLRMHRSSYDEEKPLLDRMLAIGDDGIRFIDYLAQEDVFDGPESYLEFLQRHAVSIRRGREAVTGNARAARKYAWLARYHNARVAILRTNMLASPEVRAEFELEYDFEPDAWLDSLIVGEEGV